MILLRQAVVALARRVSEIFAGVPPQTGTWPLDAEELRWARMARRLIRLVSGMGWEFVAQASLLSCLPTCGSLPTVLLRAIGSLVVILAFANAPAAAQRVEGRVLGRVSANAVVTVVASDSSGLVRVAARPEDGRYSLRLPSVGLWKVWIEALGYRRSPVDVEIRAERVANVDLLLVPDPLPIEGLVGEAQSKCPSGSRDPQVFQLWNQARGMLLPPRPKSIDSIRAEFTITRTTKRRAITAVASDSLLEDRADRRGTGGGIDRDVAVDTTISWAASPFLTLWSTALDSVGYIVPLHPEVPRWYDYEYHLPVPEVVLSTDFAQSHCFEVRQEKGRVGLTFEPGGDARLEFDVTGGIWFPTDGLQFPYLTFDYTSYPHESELWGWVAENLGFAFEMQFGERLGGRIDLAPVPELGWVVSGVVLRTPIAFWGPAYVPVSEVRSKMRRGEELDDIYPDGIPRRPIAHVREVWWVGEVREIRAEVIRVRLVGG